MLYVIFISYCSEILQTYVDRHEHLSRGFTSKSRSYRLSRTWSRTYLSLLKPRHYKNMKMFLKIKKIYGQTGWRSKACLHFLKMPLSVSVACLLTRCRQRWTLIASTLKYKGQKRPSDAFADNNPFFHVNHKWSLKV